MKYTSLGTQRCPGYSKLLPPFTRTWTILSGNKIFAIKVDLLNLESQNQAKNISVGLPISPIKIWGKSVQGFLSYDRTNKQTDWQTDRLTNRDYNFIYI